MESSGAKRYPAVFALISIIWGIILADLANPPLWLIFVLMLASFAGALSIYYRGEPVRAGIAALVCLMMISAFVFSLKYQTFPPKHIRHLADSGREYTLFCTIDDWPSLREHRTILYCRVDSISGGGETRESMGRIMLTIGNETTLLQYADRIYFDARIYSIKSGKNPYGFDYRRYLNLKGVFAACYVPTEYSIWRDQRGRGHFLNLIEHVRGFINSAFAGSLDTTAAAVASGFLIGETRDIPPEVYDYFLDTGTLHLLAVSGSNVWLVVLVFIFILRASPWSLTARTIFLLGVILFFSFLAYNQPSVVRASIMASLVLIGRASQRKLELNNIIAAAGVIILLYDPAQLYDIGFQLSFVTAWGLVYLTPKAGALFKRIHNKWYYRYLIFPALVSIIAQLVALPISAYYFQRLPAVSFISNLIIIPLVSVIVVGEVVLLFAVLAHPLLGVFFGSILNPLFDITIWFLRVFSSGTFGLPLEIKFGGWMLAGYFVLLIGAVLGIARKWARRYTVIILLILANAYMVSAIFSGSKHDKLVVFSTPGGLMVLLDNDAPTLIVSDIPRKDYMVTDRTVLPYIRNEGFDSLKAVVLGTDYHTVSEVLHLHSSIGDGGVYLPGGSRSIFQDNLRLLQQRLGTVDTSNINRRTVYYDGASLSDLKPALENGLLLYDFGAVISLDSALVLVAHDISDQLSGLVSSHGAGKDIILIKAEISNEELSSIARLEFGRNFSIICREILSKGGMGERQLENRPSSIEVIQTSQVGAVKLIISNGRVSPDI